MPKTIKKTKPQFSISLTINDKTYKSKGETALDALSTLPKPEKTTNKGILKITDGVKSNEILMTIPRMKRLFFNKGFLSVQCKMLISGMK